MLLIDMLNIPLVSCDEHLGSQRKAAIEMIDVTLTCYQSSGQILECSAAIFM